MLRTAHGDGASALVRIEVAPIDELPAGMPAAAGDALPPLPDVERDALGRLTAASAAELGRRGGHARWAKARQLRALDALGLRHEPPIETHEYYDYAIQFSEAEVTRLAVEVGGGHCPPNAASIVHSASLQLAMSRFLFATAGNDLAKITAAARLANDSRQNLLAAHELTARTATARASQPGRMDPELAKFFGD